TQLSDFKEGLTSIKDTLEKQFTNRPAPPPPPPPIDFSVLGKGLEALRNTVEAKLNTPPPSNGVGEQLRDGLKGLREDLTRAITAVHSGAMAEKVESLSHELEMIHSTLATLKDVASQQRDHLRNAQELLATRAKQGVVEFELTQEMMTNEQAFLEKFHQVLEQKHSPET